MTTTAEEEAQWLRDVLLPKLLKTDGFIENPDTADLDSFKVRTIKINFIGSEEAFMLTSCYRAAVEFELAGVVDERQLVVKKTPEVPQKIFDAINFNALFTNEISAYSKILPAVQKFAGETLNTPAFIYGDIQSNSAIVVLNDFSVQGYRMSKQKYNLPLEHVLLAVKYLGNFHGIAFALRQVDRQMFDEITGSLKDSRFAKRIEHEEWITQTRCSVRRVVSATRDHQPLVPAAFAQRFMNLIMDFFAFGKQRVQLIEPMVTLCHGDYLRNNVAFKFLEQDSDDIPNDMLMFDLQTMRVASPMMDLCTILALSAFTEVRHKHFALIFDTYCDHLAAAYRANSKGTELPEFLSRQELLKEYTRFLPYSIAIAGFFLMNLVEPPVLSSQKFLMQQRTLAEIEADVMSRGGVMVDQELAHQVKELYDLSTQLNVDVFEGFNV